MNFLPRECHFNMNTKDFDIYRSIDPHADCLFNLRSVEDQLSELGIVIVWHREDESVLIKELVGPWEVEDFDIGDGEFQVIYDPNLVERVEDFQSISLKEETFFLAAFYDDSMVSFVSK